MELRVLGPELPTHLIMYKEPWLRKVCHNRVLKKEEAEQLLEYSWDLESVDFVATPDKGCRFMHLFASFEIDNVDWTRCCVYEIAVTTDKSEATVVTFRNKLFGASAVLPPASRTATMGSPQASSRFTRTRSVFIKTVTDINCVHFSHVVKNLEATS